MISTYSIESTNKTHGLLFLIPIAPHDNIIKLNNFVLVNNSDSKLIINQSIIHSTISPWFLDHHTASFDWQISHSYPIGKSKLIGTCEFIYPSLVHLPLFHCALTVESLLHNCVCFARST